MVTVLVLLKDTPTAKRVHLHLKYLAPFASNPPSVIIDEDFESAKKNRYGAPEGFLSESESSE